MITFAIATLAILILAWVWGSRGFFSALIHLMCVIIAGAIAFGLWETIAYALLDAAGTRKWVIDCAWGVSLAIPFAVILAVLRVAIDKALPFNTDLDGASNLIGGITCGVASGVLSVGILTISITNLRQSSDSFENDMVDYETNGSIVKKTDFTTLYPRIAGGFYSFLSQNSLRTSSPMAVWRPDVAYEGSMLRTSFNNSTARFALPPSSVSVDKRYTVGLKSTNLEVKTLLSQSQTVTDFTGEPIGANEKNYYIEGFVAKFKNSARESDGRIVLGAAQVQLIVRSPDDTESRTLFPVAVVSQAGVEAGDDRVRYWRWPYSSPRTFISSVGGADDPPMAFEFLVPKNWKPLSLNIKGVRFLVDDMPGGKEYKDGEERIKAIQTYEVVALPVGAKGHRVPLSGEVLKGLRATPYLVDGKTSTGPESPINVLDTLPFNIILSADNKGGLTTTDDNRIIEGEAAFKNADLADMRGVEQKLQVRRINSEDNTVIMQVNISNDSAIAYSKNRLALEGVGAPVLVDNLGQRYSAIGYVYKDSISTRIRILPGSRIGSVSDLPDGGPSASRGDQKFMLIYQVTANVKIKTFEIGTNNVVAKIEPNIETKKF